jgi:hypothetical protein
MSDAYTEDDVYDWLNEMALEKTLSLTVDSSALAAKALELLDATPEIDPDRPQPPAPPAPALGTNPEVIMYSLVDPTLQWMHDLLAIPYNNAARVIVHCIAGQETNWAARLQVGGPARSWYQFEKGGGVHGVLTHPASKDKIKTVCDALLINCDEDTVYEAMAWNGFLATAMARLLLYTDPAPLPNVGLVEQAWEYYERNWRPGAPHPEVWPDHYAVSQSLL